MTDDAKKTRYHVLRLKPTEDAEPTEDEKLETWEVVLSDVEATSDRQARNVYVKAEYEAGRTVTATLVAVPVRSWKPQRPIVTPSPQISYQDA